MSKTQGLTADLEKKLEPIAKAMGVAVKELWVIFVREYVVHGLSQLFLAAIFALTGWFLYNKTGVHPALALIGVVPASFFAYSSIQYLGNPKYHALNDITERLKDAKLP